MTILSEIRQVQVPAPGDFVANEYTAVTAQCGLEAAYEDAYRNFGWIPDMRSTTPSRIGKTTLTFMRDRRIRNRDLVQELEQTCHRALDSIAALERSKDSRPAAAALGTGLLGSAVLASSVLALTSGLAPLAVVLGAVGFGGWALAYVVHDRTRRSHTRLVEARIRRQYEVVYATGEQASRLLS